MVLETATRTVKAAMTISQPSQTTSQLPQTALFLTALILVVLGSMVLLYWQRSDPYTQQVLSLQGNLDRGEAIFQVNCAGCHLRNVNGYVGPSLRHIAQHESDWSLIHKVTSGDSPPMPKFQPTPQDMADLLTCLERL